MTAKNPFPRQLTILGVGLLGGSIGLALRAVRPNCRIIGFGHRKPSLQTAAQIGAIDAFDLDPAAAVTGSDLIILCTPVGIFQPLLRQIAPALARGAIVTDVGSTKRSVVRSAAKLLPKSANFVASHPIAGSEKRGVEFSRADLFHNRLCILTPDKKTNPAALRQVEKFWQLLGMRVTRLTPQAHDRLLAEVSHLPHALAAALVNIPSPAGLKVCGKGFLDATRIAAGDAGLWRDIFLDNRDNLRDTLLSTRAELDKLLSLLEAQDSQALHDWLAAAAARRQGMKPPG